MSTENKNISSGAEKAENLTRKTGTRSQTPTAAPKAGANGKGRSAAKPTSSTKTRSAAKNKPQASSRKASAAEAVKIKAERKQRKLEKKLEAKQKRLDRITAMKEKKAERREARRERKELLENETKAQRIEREREERAAKLQARVARREAAAAERRAKREHRLKLRAQKRAERDDKRHAPGFGGWLAAVISLGVVTLALGTVVTFGWLNVNGMQAEMTSVQTRSLYELNSVIDELDTDLSKARVSASVGDRVRVLSDIVVESEMAEALLERLPLDGTATEQLTSFVNRMGDSAQGMLYTVAEGGELTPSQIASLKYMYETNRKIKRELNGLIADCNCAEIASMLGGKSGVIAEGFSKIQNGLIDKPEGIEEGPFSSGGTQPEAFVLRELKEITAPEAERLAREYFNGYKVSDVRCTGEAVAEGLTCYNVAVSTEDGEMLAQLTKKGGKLVMFDSYKDCSASNFSVERCIIIAEDFLADAGYGELKAVWSSENGTTCNITFAPESDGIVLYPDIIKVKVCEERGLVTGMEAISYLTNHTQRELPSATLTTSEAGSVIDGNIEVTSSRLAVIPFEGKEILCYEFAGSLGESEYYVYVDARTGDEVEVLTVVGTKQGRIIK